MPSKILVAQRLSDHIHIEVHMDISKVLADGTPDPLYIRKVDYSLTLPPNASTMAEYHASILSDLKILVARELPIISNPVSNVLPIQGQTF